MQIYTPSEPANERHRRVIADVTKDSVLVSKSDGTGTIRRAFATDGGMAMAHVPQMYSLYELYFAAALKRAETSKRTSGDTEQMRQFYIDREFDRFPLHHGVVRPLPGGKAEIVHDWLAGVGEASFDSADHMLSYSGARTTYKVDVSRLTTPPDIRAVAERFEGAEAKSGVRQLSVRDTLRASIGDASFTIDYGRPLVRGRVLLGNILPYDYVWRTGANAATQLTTSAPLTLAGIRIPAGTYTLWTVPRANGADLIINRQTGQWGTDYDGSQDLGMAPMTAETLTTPVEKFTMSITATAGFVVRSRWRGGRFGGRRRSKCGEVRDRESGPRGSRWCKSHGGDRMVAAGRAITIHCGLRQRSADGRTCNRLHDLDWFLEA
jgi:hypothetical protein